MLPRFSRLLAKGAPDAAAVAASAAHPPTAATMPRPLFKPQPLSERSKKMIDQEYENGAYNYAPLPVVISRGQGIHLYDVDDKKYIDMLSAYGAINQGHSHPKIVAALVEQASKVGVLSRAFHNEALGEFNDKMTKTFGYEKVLPTSTGVEAGETALKLARRWGYVVKGIEPNRARVLFAEGGFWGRSLAAVSSSTDPTCFTDFGPFMPGFKTIKYNDVKELEAHIKDPEVCAFMIEPIQGEAGVIVPDSGYLKKVADLCRKHKVLFIADEVQTALGRTGKMQCTEHDGVKADVAILGKALSGGIYPVSCVLSSKEVIGTIKPGEHGSTFGGNPLSCRVAIAALDVVIEENLCENAEKMGKIFRKEMEGLRARHPFLANVRGKGLMNAVDVVPGPTVNAWDVCLSLRDSGILAKPTRDNTIRFTPPLVITAPQMEEALSKIENALSVF